MKEKKRNNAILKVHFLLLFWSFYFSMCEMDGLDINGMNINGMSGELSGLNMCGMEMNGPNPTSEFYKFWNNVIELKKYVGSIEKAGYADIRIIKQCDRDALVRKIGIDDEIHLKFILDELDKFKSINEQFRDWLGYKSDCSNSSYTNDFARYCVTFENCGILTFNQLGDFISKPSDFTLYFNIRNECHCKQLFSQLKTFLS
jgi:hypothetical protein